MSRVSRPQNRSFLFVPGSPQPDRSSKPLSCGADTVVIVLEDAVEPDSKGNARRAVAAWVAGIVLPKAESASDVVALVSLTKAKIPVFPLIETAC